MHPILGDTVGPVTIDDGAPNETRGRFGANASGASEPITICVPSVRSDTLPSTIAAIRRQHYTEWELLIVVQGQDDAVAQVARNAGGDDPRIRVVHTEQRGASRARNAGVAAARHEIVAFTDDDCEPSPTWLDGLSSALNSEPGIGVAVGVLEAPPGSDGWLSFCPTVAQRNVSFRPSASARMLPDGTGFASANFAVRRWVWDHVDLFDEQLGPGTASQSGEDLDLWIRISRAGIPTRFTDEAVVVHTYGVRKGARASYRMSTAYARGQGAVAAKMVHVGDSGDEWRGAMWEQCLLTPLRTGRLDRILPAAPRLVAFERAFRRCLNHYSPTESGALRPRDR